MPAGSDIAAEEHGLPGDEYLAFMYHEVRALARSKLSKERPGHTLSATDLVNDLYLKLAKADQYFPTREGFIAAASRMIRNILVDYARGRNAAKRRRGYAAANQEIRLEFSDGQFLGVEALDQALVALAEGSERQARVVELRFFGGLTIEETAAALDVSPKTVKRDWVVARAWLKSWLDGERSAR